MRVEDQEQAMCEHGSQLALWSRGVLFLTCFMFSEAADWFGEDSIMTLMTLMTLLVLLIIASKSTF